MPSFTIRPRRCVFPGCDVRGLDASLVFSAIERQGWEEADLLQDNRRAFSVRHDRFGVWSIFRHDAEELRLAS